jgi:hypothetical protein
MNKIEICKKIQNNISKLSENEILELYKIINENGTTFTQNNNGIFVNLNWVDEPTLIKIETYISFCIKSQNEISKYELMKDMLNESIKTKDKMIEETVDILENTDISNTINKQKCSSSMKFYLLKKKYFKQNNTQNYLIDNELTYEEYLVS